MQLGLATFSSAVAAMSLVLVCCGTREGVRKPEVEARQAFTVDLPAGCEVMGGPRKLDFTVFTVVCDGKMKVGIYAGDHPNIDNDSGELAARPDIPGRQVVVAVKDPDQVARGYLLETDYAWPTTLHVWLEKDYLNDPAARKIAVSVRPTTPRAY